MITLKTLAVATKQQVFDQVATHLLTQYATSNGERGCMYRNPTGLKCAAGCLIADDEYNPEMEGKPWRSIAFAGMTPLDHIGLIQDLQTLHDQTLPCNYVRELTKLAVANNLSTKVLN